LRAPIETALANALGDPSLTVAYWSAELQTWVGSGGLVLDENGARSSRAEHELNFGGVRVARVIYDATVPRDPREVERAASLVALAFERERLAAELRASRQAVVESRERLVGAADAERRRISRGLHDGLQARLLLIGIDAQRIASAPASEVAARATALREDTDLAAAELRAIVENLVPPALIELGVAGAVEELIESMPIPTRLDAFVPERIEESAEMTAYLVVAEALSNVVKHSGATTCTVSLRAADARLHVEVTDDGNGLVDPRAGTGLAGITDRVAASGGCSGVTTRSRDQGGGTSVWAQVPFGS
jgi:signal transduction histidine kinase